MTDPLHKSGPQPGFIVVLEHIPANGSSTRKRANSCWTSSATRRLLGRPESTIPLFLFFSVARSAQQGQAERANEAQGETVQQPVATDGEKMPTDKILDVSPSRCA